MVRVTDSVKATDSLEIRFTKRIGDVSGEEESLRAWLDARPEDARGADAALIAARAALRAVPLLVGALGDDAANGRAAILLPTFRALAVASHAGTWPQQATEVAAASRAAAVTASRAAAIDATLDTLDTTAVVRAAVRAAAADAATAAADITADITRAVTDTVAAAAVAAAIARAVTDAATFAAVSLDATALESGQDHATLANFPLWPQGTPDWVTDHWDRLKDHLSSAEARAEGWDVWIKWYQTRLDGDWIRPWSSALERDIVLIDDDVWKQGPGEVNARIAGLIDDHAIRNTPLAAKLIIDPGTGRFSVETHEVAEGGDYWVALEKVADRVAALRGCQGENWFGAIKPILDDLERVRKERAGVPAFVHDRFQTALLNIEALQETNELPKPEMGIDNLARDLEMGVMDIRIAFPEVERKARARAHLRMERLPRSAREDIRGVVVEIVAEGMTEPLLGEHLKEEAEELVAAPDAPSPEGGLPEGPEKSAGYELGGWLLRMYRKATDRAGLKSLFEGADDALGKIERLIRVGTRIGKVLSWIRSLLGFFGSF